MERPYQPPWAWRTLSTLDIGIVGFLSRSFLHIFANTETHGLDRFLHILDERKSPAERQRGLITVSNHVSVLDDPMVWGVLPFRYIFDVGNIRWGLGSYDICFKNGQRGLLSAFFSYGKTLPTHRAAHSDYGGLFQPTMTQTIRLLSDPHASASQSTDLSTEVSSISALASLPPSDPFSASELTYTTNGLDTFPAPSAYPSRRFSWVHIFPEGKIHQHPDKIMRYFKWGVARLILESEPCPDVLPMWIDGPQDIMSEHRTWPRPMPRAGKNVNIWFGELADREAIFEPFRKRWRELKERARRKQIRDSTTEDPDNFGDESIGTLRNEELRCGAEAEQLRIEVTMAVRNEVLKVRRASGLPDEDPKAGRAETWREEGHQGKLEGTMEDKSVVKDI